MATIRIYRDEARGDLFPRRCVRCGADADRDTTQTFAWMPGWVHLLIFAGLLPWLIVCLIMRKSMRVTLPVCDAHRNHWLNRKLYIWGGFLFWVAFGTGLALTADSLPRDAVPVAFGVLVFGGLVWLVSGLIYVNTAVRAGEITDRWIKLTGVDKGFAEEWKEGEPEPEPRPRRKAPARRRDDEDDWDE